MVKPVVGSVGPFTIPSPKMGLKSSALVYLKICVICVPTPTPLLYPGKHHVTAEKHTFGIITFQGVSLCMPVMNQMSH